MAEKQADFESIARAAAGDRWDAMTAEERRGAIRAAKLAWIEGRLGAEIEVPTFAGWIKDQPASVQDDVLGPHRAEAYRAGKLTVRRYADAGAPLTMDEVEARALTSSLGREKT